MDRKRKRGWGREGGEEEKKGKAIKEKREKEGEECADRKTKGQSRERIERRYPKAAIAITINSTTKKNLCMNNSSQFVKGNKVILV